MERTVIDGCLGGVHVFGAFIMIWAMAKITPDFGWHGWHARWAWCRRIIYGCAAIALFGLGTNELGSDDATMNRVCRGLLLLYVLYFPLMRAFGKTTQDELANDHLDEHRAPMR